MALTSSQQAIKLFKKLMGVTDTKNPEYDFFNENILSRSAVYPTQIWKDYSQIPSEAPSSLPNSGVSGVVMRYIDLPLAAVPGTTTAFYNEQLKNAIPFNFDQGTGYTYNYAIKDSLSAPVGFGVNNWVVDTDAGVLMFYGPMAVTFTPPYTISFYKYVGGFGFGSGGDLSLVLSGTTLTLSGGTTPSSVDLSALPYLIQQVATTHRGLNALDTNYTGGTTGDGFLATSTQLYGNIVSGSGINIFINGVEAPCGNSLSDYCFFSPYSGVTGSPSPFASARVPGTEQVGDYLNWRNNAPYQLETTPIMDKIDVLFLVNKT